jgi:putative transposase
MSRIARVVGVDYPHHITQRGNNRARVFFDREDRRFYLYTLAHYCKKYPADIWAYCLMPNHVHLLVVPRESDALARAIGGTNLVYTQYVNKRYRRSGRLWQNRFYSCVIEEDRYLWSVARYIELNPLRAGLVQSAQSYTWSSAKLHLLGRRDPIMARRDWLALCDREAYREFVKEANTRERNLIRKATSSGRPLGGSEFVRSLEIRLQRTLGARPHGRPRTEAR